MTFLFSMAGYPFTKVISDKHFLAAVLAAIVFWLALYLWQQPEPDLLWPLNQWSVFLMVVLFYPIVEEWLFRGFMQGYLLQHYWGKQHFAGISSANLLTSIAFTAMHFFYHPPLAAASVFVPSLIFGYFRERHHGLLSPILLHAYYNLGYFWLFS